MYMVIVRNSGTIFARYFECHSMCLILSGWIYNMPPISKLPRGPCCTLHLFIEHYYNLMRWKVWAQLKWRRWLPHKLSKRQSQPTTVFPGLHQPGRSTNHKHWLTWVTTNNSPQDYTNLDDQPTTNHWLTWVTTNNNPQDYTNLDDQQTTNTDSPGSQPTTVLRTTPTWTINQLQTLTHLGHNQQQSSGLHQPGRSTNYKHWLTWVTTNNNPQDYTNLDDQPTTQTLTHLGHNQQQSLGLHKPGRSTNYKHWLTWVTTDNSLLRTTNLDDQPTTNTDSPGSQPTTVLRTTPTWTINQLQTLTHLGHNHKQSFSGLHKPGRSTNYKHWLTWVTFDNSPSQDYTNLDDQPTTNTDSPGSQPTTVLRTTPTWTINQLQTLTHLGHNQQQSSGLYQPGRPTNYKHWLTWVTTNNSP